jgi:hypothetical protein
MDIHCDTCGRLIDPIRAVEREYDGEIFWFCDERCLQRGRHLTVPAADEEDLAPGPQSGGDLDEPDE